MKLFLKNYIQFFQNFSIKMLKTDTNTSAITIFVWLRPLLSRTAIWYQIVFFFCVVSFSRVTGNLNIPNLKYHSRRYQSGVKLERTTRWSGAVLVRSESRAANHKFALIIFTRWVSRANVRIDRDVDN